MPLTAPTARREARNTSTYTALSRTVREVGLLRRAYRYYAWTGGVLAVALAGVIACIVVLGDSWWQLLPAGALGVLLTQCAFLAHEAAHRQVLTSGPANDRLGRFLANGVVGISYSWWMTKHSRHHANPNRVGKDPDIENDTIVFTAEGARAQRRWLRPLLRVQGWAFFPLLTLEGINLHLTSIRSLLTGPRTERRTRALELVTIAVRLTLYVGALVWFLPLGLAAAFLGVQLAVFGVYMGASFAPNHKGMAIIPADSRIDFFAKQVLTSRNIRGGPVMSVLMGGLNYQIEHHLFPSMPRPHLGRARELVREHCASQGVPYTETSLVRSYAIVVRYLNEVGLAARDPFDCPAYHRLRGV
ncbi:fatty acid desaturase family protein [Xylanimonas sp. McL0601]|uniref:fatty acid desaturase family protein n=1 Tax=Xylanimonas sp. McL0601 TaxID=3414739 RepID=UPI003CE7E426